MRGLIQGALVAALFIPEASFAAEHYVRDGGACASNCNSWTNVSDQITTALANAARGDTIWVADGSYNSITLDKPESGNTVITIKKATVQSHGTETGWSNTFGDGQATLPDVLAISDHWVLDGQTRNESDWAESAAYGFRATGTIEAHTINYGRGSNNVVFQYVDVGGPAGATFDPAIPRDGFYLGGFGSVLSSWTISRCHVHNVYLPFQIAGASNVTIEHSWLGPNWSKETIRGQTHASNIVIRHNIMKDGCQGTPGDPTAGGCTGQIAMWGGDNAGDFDGSKIYGNVIWTTKSTHHTDACILVGGDGGVTAHGVPANNVLVYNNTFVGIQSGICTIRFPGSHTGDAAQNNIWYGLAPGVITGCSANTCTNNEVIASSAQFVNAAGGNFRLASATNPGTSLPAPYNTDLDGRVRGADGVWDLGAFEHKSGGGGDTVPPASPSGLQVQ